MNRNISILLAGLLNFGTAVANATPSALVYTGMLSFASGAPYDGAVDITVSVYADALGGTALTPQTDFPSVPVHKGVLSLVLEDSGGGLRAALTTAGGGWLQFTVQGIPMSPRQRVVSVPFAWSASLASNASALGNVPASNYVQRTELGTTALSNDYADLDGTPDLSELVDQTELQNALSDYALLSDLDGLSQGGGDLVGGGALVLDDNNTDGTSDVVTLKHTAGGAGSAPNPYFGNDPGNSLMTDLVSYWTFEDAGTTLSDSMGLNPMGVVGGAPVIAGKIGQARSFNGTVSQYAIRNPVAGFPSGDLSAQVWVFSSDSTKAGTLLSYATPGNDNSFLILDYRNLSIYVGSASVASGVAVNNGVWSHVVVTRQASTGQTRLYVNGALQGTYTLAAGTGFPSGGSLVLAQDQDSVGGGFDASQAVLGRLDEVGLWSRVLSASEVAALYNAGAGTSVFWTPGIGASLAFEVESAGAGVTVGRISTHLAPGNDSGTMYFDTRAAGAGVIPRMRLDPTGQLTIAGTLVSSGNPDIAENVNVIEHDLMPGEVVAVAGATSGEGPYDGFAVRRARGPADLSVVGVLGHAPGILLHAPHDAAATGVGSSPQQRPLVLVGRVPVRMDPSSPPIAAGDLLSASELPGAARRSDGTAPTVGRALANWSCHEEESCQTHVLALVTPPTTTAVASAQARATAAETEVHDLRNRLTNMEERLKALEANDANNRRLLEGR